MADNYPVHPDRNQLVAFGLGRLDPDAATSVEAHIEECPQCCETLLDLKEDTFVALVRAAPAGTDPGSDAGDRSTDDDESVAATLVQPSARGRDAGDLPIELAEHPRYRIIELIGHGGMGDVYKAEHRLMNRPVALKVINRELVRNPQAVERFRREVQAAARLTHPNIVTAYDAEQAGDVHYLVMEYVDGEDLSQIVCEHGPLSISRACNYVRQAAAGLQHAHEQGMVHRDIKPHNLMVTGDGQIKILDFGLATLARDAAGWQGQEHSDVRASGSPGLPDGPTRPPGASAESRHPTPESRQLTTAGTMMGTPDFISPEQAGDARSVDIRSDIYSLGCTLYYLLTGRPPFDEGAVMERVKAHTESVAEPIENVRVDVPVELAEVIRRMMAKDPSERFQSPAEVANALAPFVDENRTPAVGSRSGLEDEDWSGSNRFAVACAILTTVCLLLALRGLDLLEVGMVWAAGGLLAGGATAWWKPGPFSGALTHIGWLAWGATLGLAGIIVVTTDRGTLEIDTADDSVQVSILQVSGEYSGVDARYRATLELVDTVNGSTVRLLPSGVYMVTLAGDESQFELNQQRFVLKRGDKVIVRVTRKDTGAPAPPRPPTAPSAPTRPSNSALAPVLTGQIALQTREGFYVRAVDGEELTATSRQIGPAERLVAEWRGPGQMKLRLRTPGGNYLHPSGGGGGTVKADREQAGSSEEFHVEWVDRNALKVRLRTRNGFYLHPITGGGSGVDAEIKEPGSSEVFTLVPLQPEAPNYALQFDGGSSAVSLPIRYDGSHPITLECTLKILEPIPQRNSMLITDTHDSGILFGVGQKQYVFITPRSETQEEPIARSIEPLPALQVTHVAGVFSGDDVRLFLDGKLQSSVKVPKGFRYEPSPMRLAIGANPDGPMSFRGSPVGVIDEVRISKTARYDGDFTPAQRFEPDEQTLALYHFDEGVGTLARDSSGNRLDGEIYGAKWVEWPSSAAVPGQAGALPPLREKLDALITAARRVRTDDEWEAVLSMHAPQLSVAAIGGAESEQFGKAEMEKMQTGGIALVKLLAGLPEEVREDLLQTGYLKWSFSKLDETRQAEMETALTSILGASGKMGFPAELVDHAPQMLASGDVGFAIVDTPKGQGLVWYLLVPTAPLPVLFPILDDGEDETNVFTKPVYKQLGELEEKPYSDLLPLLKPADMERLQGVWNFVRGEANGKPATPRTLEIAANVWLMKDPQTGRTIERMTFEIDPTQDPKQITVTNAAFPQPLRAIYRFDDDELHITSASAPGGARPDSFDAGGEGIFAVIMRREPSPDVQRQHMEAGLQQDQQRLDLSKLIPYAAWEANGKAVMRLGNWMLVFEGIDLATGTSGLGALRVPHVRHDDSQRTGGGTTFASENSSLMLTINDRIVDGISTVSVNEFEFKLQGRAETLTFGGTSFTAGDDVQTVVIRADGRARLDASQ